VNLFHGEELASSGRGGGGFLKGYLYL